MLTYTHNVNLKIVGDKYQKNTKQCTNNGHSWPAMNKTKNSLNIRMVYSYSLEQQREVPLELYILEFCLLFQFSCISQLTQDKTVLRNEWNRRT